MLYYGDFNLPWDTLIFEPVLALLNTKLSVPWAFKMSERNRLSCCTSVHRLTSWWLVGLESSSGYGLVMPMATQLAKMANRMKISNGLRSAVKGTTKYTQHSNISVTHQHFKIFLRTHYTYACRNINVHKQLGSESQKDISTPRGPVLPCGWGCRGWGSRGLGGPWGQTCSPALPSWPPRLFFWMSQWTQGCLTFLPPPQGGHLSKENTQKIISNFIFLCFQTSWMWSWRKYKNKYKYVYMINDSGQINDQHIWLIDI